jgi:hypothetical protein
MRFVVGFLQFGEGAALADDMSTTAAMNVATNVNEMTVKIRERRFEPRENEPLDGSRTLRKKAFMVLAPLHLHGTSAGRSKDAL